MEDNETIQEATGIIRNADGTYPKGVSGNLNGRPTETEEDKIKKAAIKKIIKNYEDKLAEMLPDIEPVIKEEAKKGNMIAIKEIHDRVMGKPLQRVANADGSNLTVEIINYGDIKRKIPTEELPDTD